MHAGNTSHLASHEYESDIDDDDDDDDGDGGGGGRLGFTIDFNLGSIHRRQDIQTKLVAATLHLRKKTTRSDNGTTSDVLIHVLTRRLQSTSVPVFHHRLFAGRLILEMMWFWG